MQKSSIKSYEDWTPPKFLQGEDGDIDMERVKLEFYTRESENAQYRQSNRSLKSQVSDLRSQLTGSDGDSDDDFDEANTPKAKSKTKGEGQGPSLNEVRLELALENGLTKNQAMRLRGENREELEADVKAYMEEHNISSGEPKGSGDGSEPPAGPPRRQPRRGDVKSGSEREGEEPKFYDPEKLMDEV